LLIFIAQNAEFLNIPFFQGTKMDSFISVGIVVLQL